MHKLIVQCSYRPRSKVIGILRKRPVGRSLCNFNTNLDDQRFTCCSPPYLHFLVLMPKIHYTRFPVTSPRRGSCQRVADLLATRPTSPQRVAVMEFGKRHDTTDNGPLPAPTCYGHDCYGETGVMDFGLSKQV